MNEIKFVMSATWWKKWLDYVRFDDDNHIIVKVHGYDDNDHISNNNCNNKELIFQI